MSPAAASREPEQGQIARVRTRKYLIEKVVPPPNPGDQTLVSLACLEDDAQGQLLDVLWEKEIDAKVLDETSWKNVAARGFDEPNIFSAYLHTLRWNCVTATDPKLFQAPYRAGIKVEAYQLEPLRKALRLPRVNLFIADDVGLGKTIEAGLILREMIMRQKVRRVVVAAPPSVVPQWKDELERRFGLTFVILNREYIAEMRRQRGYSVNPWNTHTRFIISHALLRDETYAASLRDWLGDFSAGSLFILDEAHNAAPSSGGKYAIDSDLTKTVRDIAPRFEHRLFLSATPHNGHSNSFAALLELLDSQRFCRGVTVDDSKLLQPVMVRRLKSDLREIVGGLPKRRVIQIDIDNLPPETPELRLAAMLDNYASVRSERLDSASKRAKAAAGLVITNLQKRLLSSIEAFAFTLDVHRRSLLRQIDASSTVEETGDRNLALLGSSPDANDERAEVSEEEVNSEEASQMEAATVASTTTNKGVDIRAALARELALVEEMVDVASASRGLPDERIKKIVEWIRMNLCPQIPLIGGRATPNVKAEWANKRLIIFTEYADTKRYLEQRLREAIHEADQNADRIATFHGGMGDESREAVKKAFNADPARHPLRILIATEAAREGVNLQNYCADLMHFDVPWNPSRMEQRNGRIDRKLQREDEVRCYYFVYQQRPEDHVLSTLVRKTERIEKELGSLSPVLEGKLSTLLKNGISRKTAKSLQLAIETEKVDEKQQKAVSAELEVTRERRDALQDELDQLRDMLSKSKTYLGLDDRNFQNAISSALTISGFEALKPTAVDGIAEGKTAYAFPDLANRAGADPTWAEVLDTLREPGKAGDRPWEIRDRPLRPIVFQDQQSLDDSVVHLHLEHRVVQRLLNRFLAQGFVHDDLSRACIGQADDAIPRVVVLGRLSLYGPQATRLHDEVVAVTARWIDPGRRAEPLKPYAESAESKALQLLETSLNTSGGSGVPVPVRDNLLKSVERDIAELLPHLQTRAEDSARIAEERLGKRAEQESKDMFQILESQRKQIETSIKRVDSQQLTLVFKDWNDDEKRQLDSDKKHWQKRLTQLGTELKTEPQRIRANYEVNATRIEPVGIVYLWPISG